MTGVCGSDMLTMGSVSGQMCIPCNKKTCQAKWLRVLSNDGAEGLYTVSYPWVPETRDLERINGQLVINGIELIDTFTVNVYIYKILMKTTP